MSTQLRSVIACVVVSGAAAGLAAAAEQNVPQLRRIVGPVEDRAHQITQDSPAPRRTASQTPSYPNGAPSISAAWIQVFQITVDRSGQSGRVVEARAIPSQLASDPAGLVADVATQRSATEAFAREAIAAIRQWVYERPARAPVTFPIGFLVKPGADPAVEEIVLPVRAKHADMIAPDLARSARVLRTVYVEATVGIDGSVGGVRVAQSVPLLDQTAIDAVRQWRFTPARVGGRPIAVVIPIAVTFR